MCPLASLSVLAVCQSPGLVEEGSGGAFVRRVAAGVESWEVQALMLGLMFLDLLATMALCVADQVRD